MVETKTELILRDVKVRTDIDGNVCLNDLWRLGGEDGNRRPNKWWRGQGAKVLTSALLEKIGRNSPNLGIPTEELVYRSTGRGRAANTFAHPVLALAYAEFVEPALGVEVREIFVRFKAKDVTLAFEILDGLAHQAEYDELRIELRERLKQHNRMLSGAAKEAQVTDFRAFNGAGLQGLYGGLTKAELLRYKGLRPTDEHLNHANHEELAANYFKATQAEAKLRRDRVNCQTEANRTHREVGETVRATIGELGGTMPEDEPALEHIRAAQKRLKKFAPVELGRHKRT